MQAVIFKITVWQQSERRKRALRNLPFVVGKMMNTPKISRQPMLRARSDKNCKSQLCMHFKHK